METESKSVVIRGWGVGEMDEGVMGINFLIRQTSPGDVTYSLVTIVYNNVFYIGKKLRD